MCEIQAVEYTCVVIKDGGGVVRVLTGQDRNPKQLERSATVGWWPATITLVTIICYTLDSHGYINYLLRYNHNKI